MRPTALVVTTVHWPDDTRIRERLIRSLSSEFEVVYASRSPGPTDPSGLEYRRLSGGRLRRGIAALEVMLRTHWDVLVVHDPELVPAALLSSAVLRRRVVFDVHEDYAAAAHIRVWIPKWLAPVVAGLVRIGLRLAERFLTITLAEAGYRRLFTGEHPVFPNFPDTSAYPPVEDERLREAVYLGDATRHRGVDVAIEACRLAGIPLRLIGRVADEIRHEIPRFGNVVAEGVLSNPAAIRAVSRASVGLVPLRDLGNYRHSQPTKLLEYLAAGVPVVASDLPGTRELVEGLNAVQLVPPGDAEAMAEAIGESLSETTLEIASEQAEVVRSKFKWPEHDVVSFYKTLVNP